jgi:undecaprenyl diphosphate synthase
MSLFVQYLEKEMKDLAAAGVRLKVIGDVEGFAPDVQQRIKATEAATAHNELITLCVAANYGGRWDVVQAVKTWQLSNPNRSVAELTEAELAQALSTADMPEVDLMIRTGGEQRISNFLLWQSAYAELYFTDVLWPEFGDKDFDKALEWYAKRTRRFGKTTEQVEGESIKVGLLDDG